MKNDRWHIWLLAKWKTPNGTIRKNNPFGPLEEKVLLNYDRCEEDAEGNKSFRAYDTNDNWFGYEVKQGKVTIIDVNYKGYQLNQQSHI